MIPGTALSALDADRNRRLERIIALARLGMALLALLVLQLEPAGPAQQTLLVNLLSAYTAYASLVALLVLLPVPNLEAWRAAVHWLDVLWALVITSVSSGPASIFFVFFVFVVVGAAYRWGLRETVMTGVLVAIILAVQALSPLPGPFRPWTGAGLGQLVTRGGYVVGLAFLMGYLAEEQNRERRLEAVTARMLGAVSWSGGFRASLERVLSELADAFGARRAALVAENRVTGFLYVWTLPARGAALQLSTGTPAERDVWWCALPADSSVWLISRRRGGPVLARRPGGGTSGLAPPAALGRLMESSRRLLVGDVDVGPEWRGRLLLHDPVRSRDERGRRWLAGVLPQAGAALYSAYLLGRLRERATSAERARIARELHDGLIQSLIGLEMRVDALRRQPDLTPSVLEDLADIQGHLHEEAVQTRELMQEIRPVETDGTDIPALLASLAERFRRDSGIDTRFTCDLEDPVVPPRVARELMRVAQEALVNVRKHSGARQVVLDFGATADAWRLAVDDNGRGFDFDGRFSLDELDQARRGPLVIKQRVRGMGGTLALASTRGHGSRLEVTVPRKTR